MIDKIKNLNLIDKLKMKKLEFKNKNFLKNEFSLKLKDISLLISAIVLIGIGYMNFSSSSEFAKSSNSIGDVELVSSNETLVENEEIIKEIDDSKATNSNSSKNNELDKNEASGLVENDDEESKNEVIESSSNENIDSQNEEMDDDNKKYFSELRLERDNMYSRSLETYQQIIDSEISNDQKAIAIQEIENINTVQNEIKIAEELIKLKDFEDVIIYKNDNSVSVIVRCAALSNSQVAQIQNIVSRQLDVDVGNISISNK